MHFSLKSVYYQNITKILKINLFFIGFEKIYKFFVLRFAENLPVTFKKKKFLPRIYCKMIVTKKGRPLILIDKLKRRIVALQGGIVSNLVRNFDSEKSHISIMQR